ncbi:MAG: C39 family peptidase [Candidatus Falkowbacteria bacterium]|nr:C39 family peptidase [Candidatus Falkowbacteria bacterium]
MLVIFFVWQVPKNQIENIEINQANTTIEVLVEERKDLKPPAVVKTETNNEQIKVETTISKLVDQVVPFTSQAPFGGWSDERQQDGCEEASALMAVYWARGDKLSKLVAWEKISDISDFELRNYGEYRDITLDDVVDHVFKDYFSYEKVELQANVSIDDIISELNKGNLVLAPMDGQKLHNPYFTAPGPERHMIVIRGYDPTTKEFITNDPGTKRGEAYRYNEDILYEAIRVYPTGYHEEIKKDERSMIIVRK